MAQKAKKELAKNNASTLNNLHIAAAGVHIIFWAWHFLISRRNITAYVVLSIPSIICEYVLEKTGRPKFDAATNALKTPGEDMAAQGLTEYMFDLVWITWASVVLVVFVGNWAWFLMALVPGYAVYLGSGLLGMGKQKMAHMQDAQAQGQAAPQGNRRSRRTA